MLLHRAPPCPRRRASFQGSQSLCHPLGSYTTLHCRLVSLRRSLSLGSEFRVLVPFPPSLLAPCTCTYLGRYRTERRSLAHTHPLHPLPPLLFFACAFLPPGPWPMDRQPKAHRHG
ncbi:hypothetical protein LY76DRAFT_352445 [Colletotrichum caudatum]|nr:hypothetical protein LY76DRAFT_352445 [Colletotrichum caudatum]